MEKIKRTIALVAPIQDVTATQINFTDIQLLRNKKWKALEAFNLSQVTKAPNGKANVPDALFNSAFITLQDRHGKAIIQQMPLTSFNTELNAGRFKEIELTNIDIPNSFLQVYDLTGATTSQSFILNVIWDDMPGETSEL